MSDSLCNELILEIFKRLPTKSLLRFRSVSKSLCSDISSPDFIRAHTLLSPPKVLIRHRYIPEDKDFYTVHLEGQLPLRHLGGYNDETTFEVPYSDQFNIVGSCNGILCVYEYCGIHSLWNPSIRRKIILLPVPFSFEDYVKRNTTAHGFGFDSINDDYKIVWISYAADGLSPARAYIYTLKTNDWREVPLPTTPFYSLATNAWFVNGTLNWLVDVSLDGSDLLDNSYILTFDFSTDNFAMIELPEPNWQDHLLTVIKGSIAVTSRGNDFTRFWMRKEDNNTAIWSEVYKLDLLLDGPDKILEMTTNGNLLFHSCYSGQVVYNLETGVLSNLVQVNDESPKVNMEKYIETLELFGKGKTYEVKQPSFLRK